MMGKIACANVVSDVYAMGVSEIDNILMLLAISTKMSKEESSAVTPLIIQGFKDSASEAGAQVTGGDTVWNPWFTIGGVATSVCSTKEFIMPDNARVGDVLVLTKPLGAQLAVHAHAWLSVPQRWDIIKQVVTEEEVLKAYKQAVESMVRLNNTAAKLMHVFNAHGATDVTGFGLLGHAQNLARFQKHDVSFVIHNLPIIHKITAIAKVSGNITKLLQGTYAETSGGLLVIIPRDEASAYCKELKRRDNHAAWVVGVVEKGSKTARLIEKPRIIEIKPPEN